MEQILPALEGRLRRFHRDAAWLAAAHPGLARHLTRSDGAPDVDVDRLVQGVATLHARTALALRRARWRQDEHWLELHFPEQLRPFPACRIGPGPQPGGAAVLAARYAPGPQPAIELELELGGAADGCAAGAGRIPGWAGGFDVCIDGDAAFCAALRCTLLAAGRPARCDRAAALRPEGGEWRTLAHWPFTPTGLDPAEALLPRRPGSHAGLALLREFLAFPARFNVLRLRLPGLAGARRWTVRLPAPGPEAPEAPLLAALHAGHLRPGWTASAGLQRAAAAPIRLDGRQSEYLLSVPPELEIFSIDSVRIGGAVEEGWSARHVGAAPAGHEWRLAFSRQTGWQAGAVASVDVICCRRGEVLGRAARGAACRWQLNSLLALEQLPCSAAALREMMATQAIGNSASAQAIVGAVRALDARPSLLRPGRAAPFTGTELLLRVDETVLGGCGALLFAQVMDRFFGECAHMNTFTRLVLVSASSGEELIRCRARNAGTLLE